MHGHLQTQINSIVIPRPVTAPYPLPRVPELGEGGGGRVNIKLHIFYYFYFKTEGTFQMILSFFGSMALALDQDEPKFHILSWRTNKRSCFSYLGGGGFHGHLKLRLGPSCFPAILSPTH